LLPELHRLALHDALPIYAVILDPEETRVFGAVEKWSDAKKCAELFKANRDRIDGILVTLPNFGDERSVADAIRLSGLNVPVLVQDRKSTRLNSSHVKSSY